ncbi:hypothetical protein F7725_000136 [Dissostichus mawsoni]|uniref:Brain natriuretic peptide n=1 Tax=Dissostichus mawsoni TaxID=36200 RepID=A0A7J5ZFC8_DISMA|nr:hypothetical protein F7725_000136 [Dissostichus mawsoni]
MCLSSIPLCGFLLILNLQLFCTSPISPGLSDADIDFFKTRGVRFRSGAECHCREEPGEPEHRGGGRRTAAPPNSEAAIREFLSAKNLKSVRNDSTRKSSSCFGRRMDRIGSMSSLGCNTVGKYSKLQ